jgi:hypothetical protein
MCRRWTSQRGGIFGHSENTSNAASIRVLVVVFVAHVVIEQGFVSSVLNMYHLPKRAKVSVVAVRSNYLVE